MTPKAKPGRGGSAGAGSSSSGGAAQQRKPSAPTSKGGAQSAKKEGKPAPATAKTSAEDRQSGQARATPRQAQGKGSELEQLAAEYDQAILAYEGAFKRQQQRAYALARSWGGSTVTSGVDLAEREGRLQFLEQAVSDFAAAQSYLESLNGEEKKAYVESWREYLLQTAQLGEELIADLEREIGKGGDTQMHSADSS